MRQLSPEAYQRVRPLLGGMRHNLIMTTVVEGTSPGRVWVDREADPGTVLMCTPEGHFVAGERPNRQTVQSLRDLIQEEILPGGRKAGWAEFYLHYPLTGWEDVVADLVEGTSSRRDHQQYFVLEELRLDWREGMPERLRMQRVDKGLLGRDELANTGHLRGWATWNFGSITRFLERGFGYALVHEAGIVSWCLSDCVSGHRCEIGIHTDERYRRRGFAKRTAAAAVEHCLERGLTDIGWHCWSGNAASASTARAVGFAKVLDHPGVIVRL